MPIITGHWKFNLSLLDREDFRLKLTRLVQHKLVGVVVGNKWWENLKDSIWFLNTQYSQVLDTDKTKNVKTLNDSQDWLVVAEAS